jgi:hypothetical protein
MSSLHTVQSQPDAPHAPTHRPRVVESKCLSVNSSRLRPPAPPPADSAPPEREPSPLATPRRMPEPLSRPSQPTRSCAQRSPPSPRTSHRSAQHLAGHRRVAARRRSTLPGDCPAISLAGATADHERAGTRAGRATVPRPAADELAQHGGCGSVDMTMIDAPAPGRSAPTSRPICRASRPPPRQSSPRLDRPAIGAHQNLRRTVDALDACSDRRALNAAPRGKSRALPAACWRTSPAVAGPAARRCSNASDSRTPRGPVRLRS